MQAIETSQQGNISQYDPRHDFSIAGAFKLAKNFNFQQEVV